MRDDTNHSPASRAKLITYVVVGIELEIRKTAKLAGAAVQISKVGATCRDRHRRYSTPAAGPPITSAAAASFQAGKGSPSHRAEAPRPKTGIRSATA